MAETNLLYRPNGNEGATIIRVHLNGTLVEAKAKSTTHTRILSRLNQRRSQHLDRPSLAWYGIKKLASSLCLSESYLSRRVGEINILFREAALAAGVSDPPTLIEQENGFGYRVRWAFEESEPETSQRGQGQQPRTVATPQDDGNFA